MALTSGFFNSVGGDRKYNAESMNRIFEGIIMRGIMPSVGEKFKVTAGSGMRVYVGSGKFMGKYGHWLNNDTLYEVTLNTSSATVDRYEAITLVVDTGSNARSVSIGHKIYNSRPTSAVFEGNTETYIIAYVLVRKGTSQILQSDITDTRANSAMCGYATNLLEHLDTSDWFTQYQAATDQFFKQLAAWELQQKTNYLAWETQQKSAFDSWFAALTGELKVGAYIQKYQSAYTTTSTLTIIPINIPDYDPTSDILIANINGVMLVEVTDYAISGTGTTAKITLKSAVSAGNKISFTVLKSKIGTKA